MDNLTSNLVQNETICGPNGDCGSVVANSTVKTPADPQGIALAYFSLVVMALLPIFFGSFRSVRFLQALKDSGKKSEHLTRKDAAMFPFYASFALFGLYMVFKIFGPEYINLLLTLYFLLLGILALSHLSSPLITPLVPAAIPKKKYCVKFQVVEGESSNNIVNYVFSSHDLVCLVFCSIIGFLYLLQKHWILNNIFGIAFALNGVEMLHLNNVITGCILLGGLFIYDIFWVFGTDVMVTVALSFEAPIKLIFPQDILQNGFVANNFAMLGLGDIVIPGIFIALLLRFDCSLNRNSKMYFYSTFVAYVFGLLFTIAVMHTFKHAQPALLYLVPCCLGVPLSIALVKGDISAMFQYQDHPNQLTTEVDESSELKVPVAKKEK